MTAYQAPLKLHGANGITGVPATDTSGYVTVSKVISLGGGAVSPRQIITLPANATLLRLGGVATSAFEADVSAVNINFGNSGQATRYGVISVSALGLVRFSTVSGATDFDTGGTIVITGSAVSTALFTLGGFRAFIEYAITE